MVRKRDMGAAVALAALLVAGGCSGGDDPTIAGPTSAGDTTSTTADASTTSEVDGSTSVTGPGTTACVAEALGEATSVSLPDGRDGRVAAVLDLDDDGDDEMWVQAGSGASVLLYSLFRVEVCDLVPVTLADTGQPAEFAAGGTVGTQTGVFCTDSGAVVAVTASSTDGELYEGNRVEYRLVDGALVVQEDVPFFIDSSDPEFPDLSTFRC